MEILNFIKQIRKGQEADWKTTENFYNKSFGILKGKLFKLIRNYSIDNITEDDLEDIISNTITEFIKNLYRNFKGNYEGEAVNYLYAILRTELRKYLNKHNSFNHVDNIDDQHEITYEDYQNNYIKYILHEYLEDCIERLPATPFDLPYIMAEIMRGTKPAVIAAELNVEPEIIYVARQDSKDLIRSCLERKGINNENIFEN